MLIVYELLEKIERYLDSSFSDSQLETWVVSNLQRILDSGDAEAIHVANEVDASFVELGEDIIDRPTLIERLRTLATEASTPS